MRDCDISPPVSILHLLEVGCLLCRVKLLLLVSPDRFVQQKVYLIWALVHLSESILQLFYDVQFHLLLLLLFLPVDIDQLSLGDVLDLHSFVLLGHRHQLLLLFLVLHCCFLGLINKLFDYKSGILNVVLKLLLVGMADINNWSGLRPYFREVRCNWFRRLQIFRFGEA